MDSVVLKIRSLTSGDHEAYSEFVRQGEQVLPYTPRRSIAHFLSEIIPGDPVCLLALEGNRIVGSLPYFRVEVPGEGTIINSLPWYGSHGACTLSQETSGHVRRALLERYLESASAPGVLSSTLILSHGEEVWRSQYEEVLKPCAMDMRNGQVSELPPDGPDLGPRLEMSLSRRPAIS